MTRFLGLSSCPIESSGNVGDLLITQSVMDLFHEIDQTIEFITHFRGEDFQSRLDYLNGFDAVILFGTPIINSDMHPQIFKLTENLDEIKIPIIPVSGIYNYFPAKYPVNQDFFGIPKYALNLNRSTLDFIERLETHIPNGHKFPVRTDLVKEVLEINNIDAEVVGDPAWYAPTHLDSEFKRPSEIKRIVFTPPHNRFYVKQAMRILGKLAHSFPDAKKTISFQSSLTRVDKQLREFAQDNWDCKYTSHDVHNLDFYETSDLHVGYRKHGHLAHLSQRIPSVVLAEDSRALGLMNTFQYSAGFSAYECKRVGVNVRYKLYTSLPSRAYELANRKSILDMPSIRNIVAEPTTNLGDEVLKEIQTQLSHDWQGYDAVARQIDETYSRMRAYLNSVLIGVESGELY